MIVDALSLAENETIEADVCIVGAGVAGITVARELIGQSFRVLLLESGGFEPDEDTQSLYCGENGGHPYYALEAARARYFGGSSNSWYIDIGNGHLGARLRPLDHIDFEERDWVPFSGWPFSKSHLDPFYDRAQAICRIEPLTYDVRDWENPEKTPRLPFVGDGVKTIIYKFASRENFVGQYRADILRADNIMTYLHANAVELETNETAQKVTRLHVACLGGHNFTVSAKIFILAIGGIEVPRLLLLSNKTMQNGLGNQNDLVGRYFMEHLHFWSGVYIPSRADIFNSTTLYTGIHTANQVPIIGKLALHEDVLRHEKLLNQNVELIPSVVVNPSLFPSVTGKGVDSFRTLRSAVRGGQSPREVGKHLSNVVTDIDEIATVAYARVKRRVSRIFNTHRVKAFRLANMTEQVPNPDSRVSLTGERDKLGRHRVRLEWHLSPIDILSTIRTQQIIGEEVRKARLGKIYIELKDARPPSDLHGGYHHMGTTRMHVDPKKGVVDENCRIHGMSNLLIAGPSVFPTGGYANPALTIVALAVRLADHVKQLMSQGNIA